VLFNNIIGVVLLLFFSLFIAIQKNNLYRFCFQYLFADQSIILKNSTSYIDFTYVSLLL